MAPYLISSIFFVALVLLSSFGKVMVSAAVLLRKTKSDKKNAVDLTVGEKIEEWVRKKRKEKYFSASPGISVAVIDADGFHIFGDGFQTLDKVTQQPVDGNTLFEIGSLSKTLTALALSAVAAKQHKQSGQSGTSSAVEEGNDNKVLSFDDPVQRWIGTDFKLGSNDYISSIVTIRDLLAHRTGLAEGQGDVLGSFMPPSNATEMLAKVQPLRTLRDKFQYSNTGWMLAGEVLRASSPGAQSWCDALHIELLEPLGLNNTFCHRNEIPDAYARKHLASVHKHDPCGKVSKGTKNSGVSLATFEFLATGNATSYAWGAADAAGSVISSANDMAKIMRILLNATRKTSVAAQSMDVISSSNSFSSRPVFIEDSSSGVLSHALVSELMQGQMVVPTSWMKECGIATAGYSDVGRGNAAGLGFDIASEISPFLSPDSVADSKTQLQPYVEKNGDTNMHKARMGLLPALHAGCLFLSNLGGSMGCQLTALKFGALALLAGGNEADANLASARSLNSTDFVQQQWIPGTTCTACNRSGASGDCNPSGLERPSFSLKSVSKSYTSLSMPFGPVILATRNIRDHEISRDELTLSAGPLNDVVLQFSNASSVKSGTCQFIAQWLSVYLNPWAQELEGRKLSSLIGNCSLAEFILPPEILAAGVSATNGTVAFPWGCGLVPLPDGPQVFIVVHESQGVLVSMFGEALWSV